MRQQYVSNYATFLRFGAMDWEKPFVEAAATQDSPEMLLRSWVGCAFCARSFWTEELDDVFLQGEQCFMQNPDAVWTLTGVDRYHERWPLIPLEERCGKKCRIVFCTVVCWLHCHLTGFLFGNVTGVASVCCGRGHEEKVVLCFAAQT